ncbi:BlaI/MecI/CopY family transcriptional regulator [Vermiculatibacterium agrestimuris]|uniref:BlaI/MecI/CopY family transcriptional regulator n=1 Tax=Vermiculatibacterium agrestimuris TaxID=2941519 RepID=UPI0020422DC9|nr:BlaI/MecI/CopY family transcriptional regulator [Vermiculatibacterium agrestimuris]
MGEHKNLPESELDIMLAVWRSREAATAPAILAALERPLTASALHSYLKRLEEKGFLRCEKAGRVNRYIPLISEEEYRRQAGGAVLEKLYEGSLKTFAAALWDGGRLSQSEVAELREYLDALEGGRE